MDTMIDRRTMTRLTLAFLVDHAKMDATAIAQTTGISRADLDLVLAGEDPTLSKNADRAIDKMAAMQSMLLSAYTPASAALWLTTPTTLLSGRVPIDVMIESDGIDRVLNASIRRVSL